MRCRSVALGPPRLTAAGRERQQAGVRAGHRAQRRKYFARVEARCRDLWAPLSDRVSMQEALPVLVQIYTRGYNTGYYCTMQRLAKQRRAVA